jgi:hypothetical protein
MLLAACGSATLASTTHREVVPASGSFPNGVPWCLQVVNSTGSVSLADRGRITTGLEYYFGAFGTTVMLDEVINQVRFAACSNP